MHSYFPTIKASDECGTMDGEWPLLRTKKFLKDKFTEIEDWFFLGLLTAMLL